MFLRNTICRRILAIDPSFEWSSEGNTISSYRPSARCAPLNAHFSIRFNTAGDAGREPPGTRLGTSANPEVKEESCKMRIAATSEPSLTNRRGRANEQLPRRSGRILHFDEIFPVAPTQVVEQSGMQ